MNFSCGLGDPWDHGPVSENLPLELNEEPVKREVATDQTLYPEKSIAFYIRVQLESKQLRISTCYF